MPSKIFCPYCKGEQYKDLTVEFQICQYCWSIFRIEVSVKSFKHEPSEDNDECR